MKKLIIFGGLLLATRLPAQILTSAYTNSPTAVISDNNPNGWSTTFAVGDLGGTITNVQVSLNITGGFNGDLYAYLMNPSGQMAILLNRVGVSSTSEYGYNNAGFNITLDSSVGAGNVHGYQSLSPSYSGGQLTGTWAPDGRNIDPQSVGISFESAVPTLTLNNFSGNNPNGAWVFFIADMSSGGQSTLQNVVLTIMTVPEPRTGMMLGSGLLLFGLLRRRWRR